MLAVSRGLTPNPWTGCRSLSPGVAAVLGALHLRAPDRDALRGLSARQWQEALHYSDRSRLTLFLNDAAGESMPPWVRERMEQNRERNCERLHRIEAIHREIARTFEAAGIEFVTLKGLTHEASFGVQPRSRMQYDIDLFVPGSIVRGARDVLLSLGYEPVEGTERFPTDHLPTMVRKTAWEWRRDYFDLEIPTPIELHYRFWNERTERLRAPGADSFWKRRMTRQIAGTEMGVLSRPDALGYAALHVLRHVLRGSSHPSHVYEISACLELHADDDGFWKEWAAVHEPELRRLEAVAFRFAQSWFGCRLAPMALAEIDRLPEPAKAWFETFAISPVLSPFDSNKDEIWLHCALLDSRRQTWNMLRRRMLPGRLPLDTRGSHVPQNQWNRVRRARARLSYTAHLASRVAHHALALPRTALSGARWWWEQRSGKLG